MNRLPRSKKEAVDNPIKVIGLDIKATKENLKKGYFEPHRWILNRPMSLEFDCGILIKKPIKSGELIL